MSIIGATSLGCLCVAVTTAAQTIGPNAAATATADKASTLRGCVGRSRTTDGMYTVSDFTAVAAVEPTLRPLQRAPGPTPPDGQSRSPCP
jgi:hypothetical protein